MRWLPALLALSLTACARRASTSGTGEAPTRVYAGGRIRTLDPQRPEVKALAVRDGKVLAAGEEEEVLRVAGAGAQRVELGGATLVPGLTDAHGHLEELGQSLSRVKLQGTRSEAEVIARVAAAGRESFQGDWLLGRGWDQNLWPEGQRELPGRAKLDARFPTTPVYLTRVDGHAAWVNGAALRRAGITRTTPDPAGGRILRDARGEPTGVLIDDAMELVGARLPPPSDAQRQGWLKAAIDLCAKRGLTSVHDARMGMPAFHVLQQWDMIGALPIRIYAMADGQGEDAQVFLERGPFEGRHLTMRAVKLFADGALGSRGAALESPYSDEPGQRGLLILPGPELDAKARAFAERGFQVAVHAIGDRANTVTMEVLGALEKQRPGSRHRVEHAQLLSLSDVPKFAERGLIASMQPAQATSDMPWVPARVGPERAKGAYLWKSLLDSGARLAFGSDFPIEDPSPLEGLYAARTRQDKQGAPAGGWMPEQRMTGEQALRGFTEWAAYAAFAEGKRGKMKEGFDADFTVLSVDPVEAPPEQLLKAEVWLTVVAGRPVHASGEIAKEL